MNGTLAQRLWSRVHILDGRDACWEWRGARNPSGHGRIGVGGKKQKPTHRVVYELLIGPIPDGAHLDHLCENPPCVNPNHLEPVGLWENLSRSAKTPAVINAAKTHCKRGHEFTPENTYRYIQHGRSGESRACKTCMRERAAAKYRGETYA